MKKLLITVSLLIISLTSPLSFSGTLIHLHPNERVLELQEARVFPRNCFSTIVILKNRIGMTLSVLEKESKECGDLFGYAEPMSLSFQEEVDSCGVIKTFFNSQNNISYEAIDTTFSNCSANKNIQLKISSPHHAFDSITKIIDINESQITEDSPKTCMAYFQGYKKDKSTGECIQASQSGCSNPFPFQTLNECQNSESLF